LKEDPSRIFTGLYGLAPLLTNLAPILRNRFEQLDPYTSRDWLSVASVLAETHDPTLVPIFMRAATPTNALMIREWAFRVLGRNGYSNDPVEATLREALTSTNGQFRGAAIATCAYLNVCTQEALTSIRERRAVVLEIGPTEIQNIEIYEPLLRWRANTNDVQAAEAIERNLQTRAKYANRLWTAELLGKIGPSARQFAPTLVQIAQAEGPPVQNDALRALKNIAPDEARKVLAVLPPRRVLHARTAGPAK
jgi:HEAT repeat protein